MNFLYTIRYMLSDLLMPKVPCVRCGKKMKDDLTGFAPQHFFCPKDLEMKDVQ